MDLFDWTPPAPQVDLPQPPIEVPYDVATLFEKLALTIAETGYKKFSSDAILHRIRWHHQIERGDRGFKCNNNWTAPLARWFLAKHPELPGFFELRERVGAESEWVNERD